MKLEKMPFVFRGKHDEIDKIQVYNFMTKFLNSDLILLVNWEVYLTSLRLSFVICKEEFILSSVLD